MSETTTARAVCPHDCPDTCGLVITLEGDRAVALAGDREHAFTRGFLCHKVSRDLDRVYHPDRLQYPQRRVGPKGAGRFERITWDEALSEIARRFADIAAGPDGPQAILPYSYYGTMGKIQAASLDRRFFHRLGASLLDRTICATAGGAGYAYTIGAKAGMAPEGFAESRYIMNWGSNTAVTNSHLWVLMHEARKRGAKIVTIDPYRCRTAERSDWHIQPRVGTDAALALGMMHVVFREGLEDRDYLEQHTLGHAELRERVLHEYDPRRVAKITGLDAADIERLAHEYAGTKPAAIRINYGMQRHYGGGMAVRTIACLPAVIGAWREFGGGILLSTSGTFPLNTHALERPDLSPRGTRTINMSQLAEALHLEVPSQNLLSSRDTVSGSLPSPVTGEGQGVGVLADAQRRSAPPTPALPPQGGEGDGELVGALLHNRAAGPAVKALYVFNSNPAAVAPNQKKVLQGLLREDLFTVVHEQFATDTVDYADIVLPATTQLEHFDLHTSYGHHWLQVNRPCIPPLAEARCNTWVFRQLADRLGFEPELFQISDEDLARQALWEGSDQVPEALRGITLDRLIAEGPVRLNLPERFMPFASGNFPTPSGKCEFRCERLAAIGFDPLPTWIPPAECAETTPELAQRYPLQLLSPPSPHFLNSTFVNIDSLRASAGEPQLQLHPDDAERRSIRSGDRVRVFNDRGAFEATAVVGHTVRPGVAVAPSIWWNKYASDHANVNATTSSRLTDLGGGATFFDNLVDVEVLP